MADSRTTRQKVEAGLAARHFKERAFQITGMIATTVGVLFLGVFFADLFSKGSSAFVQTFINLDVEFDEAHVTHGFAARNVLHRRSPTHCVVVSFPVAHEDPAATIRRAENLRCSSLNFRLSASPWSVVLHLSDNLT